MDDFLLSILVPVYNEEETIYPFFERMVPVLEELGTKYEIVFINDGSRDRTVEKIELLHKKNSSVKLVDLSRNFGKEPAMSAGLDYVSGDAVVPMDVDLQDPPELIPEMVRLWQEGADVVYAERAKRDGDTFVKKMTANLFYRVLEKVAHTHIPRNVGDFRLMDKRVVEHLRNLPEKRRFMKGLFAWVGFNQVALPYEREDRCAGETKFNFWKLWNFALEGLTSFSIAPLQWAMYLGFFTSFMAFVYALFIVGKTLYLGVDVPGYASLMVTMLFIGGIQLVAIGCIGEYIGRIYDEVKNRPLYLVKRELGMKHDEK